MIDTESTVLVEHWQMPTPEDSAAALVEWVRYATDPVIVHVRDVETRTLHVVRVDPDGTATTIGTIQEA